MTGNAPLHLLAFDLGTSTGWACAGAGYLRTGTIVSPGGAGDSHGGRFARFYAAVDNLINTLDPQAVCYEYAGHSARRSGQQADLWFGWRTILLLVCHTRRIPAFHVTTGQYKVAFGLHGRCGKNDIGARCAELGIQCANADEADAVAILNWALGEYGCKIQDFKQIGETV